MSADQWTGRRKRGGDLTKLDQVIAEARRSRSEREKGYREQSLRIHPWVCARCGREFNRANLHQLTVHHKDHNHDNNPPDGSNWENLCLYCHENEHRRYLDHLAGGGSESVEDPGALKHSPFAALAKLMADKKMPD